MSGRRHTTETKQAVLDAYTTGLPVYIIARQHGVASETIRSWARQEGIGPRPGVTATCKGCGQQKRCHDQRMCSTCLADVPLTGGRWVPVGAVLRWIEEEAA